MRMHHNLPHWNYFRLLERDLEECFRFVHPCTEHFSVYSDHFARIILMACTEIENCLNSLAVAVGCTPKPESIGEYQSCVSATYPQFNNMKIDVPRYALAFEPWQHWTSSAAPDWWTFGYNKIKHDRMGHPQAPTMFRAMSSVGALLVLLLHYYRQLHGRHCMMPTEISPCLLVPHEGDDGIYGSLSSWIWTLPGEAAI
jgi:hypothetical protein